MSKFKVGEAKTRGGFDAFIFDITKDRIFGKVNIKGWMPHYWLTNGLCRSTRDDEFDLLPNHEQLRAEFEATVYGNTVDGYIVDVPIGTPFKSGCRVKVTLESLE